MHEAVELAGAPTVEHPGHRAGLRRRAREEALDTGRVVYERRFCWVIARISDRRIAIFTAADGTGAYTNPKRQSLKPGQRVDYNARGAKDGSVSLSD